VELDGVPTSHKELATIDDGAGGELDILRDNMPYGRPGSGEFGTYFIGYSARLWVIERMLLRMFVGVPHGTHDRILDFSTAVTGGLFYVPTADFLDDQPPRPTSHTARKPAPADDSLNVGGQRKHD
jgi:putative iron-dependent peroxidase